MFLILLYIFDGTFYLLKVKIIDKFCKKLSKLYKNYNIAMNTLFLRDSDATIAIFGVLQLLYISYGIIIIKK